MLLTYTRIIMKISGCTHAALSRTQINTHLVPNKITRVTFTEHVQIEHQSIETFIYIRLSQYGNSIRNPMATVFSSLLSPRDSRPASCLSLREGARLLTLMSSSSAAELRETSARIQARFLAPPGHIAKSDTWEKRSRDFGTEGQKRPGFFLFLTPRVITAVARECSGLRTPVI